MNAAVELKGLAELDRRLTAIGNKMAGQALRNASNEGARVIRDEARRRIPVKSGRTRRAIRVFQRRRGVKSGVTVAIGVRGGKGGRQHIARFLEFGTKAHIIAAGGVKEEFKGATGRQIYLAKRAAFDQAKAAGATNKQALRISRGALVKKVEHPGMPAHPWLRPAFDVAYPRALKAMMARLRAEIEQAERKLGRR